MFWPWLRFGSHFGGALGAQMEAKAIKKPLQKSIKKMMPKMTSNWSQMGSQNGAKIVKNEVLEAPCFKGVSQVASRPPPGSILERFWDHFWTIFISFSSIFLMIVACFLHAFCSSMLQTSAFKITRSHQKETSREGLRNSFSLRAILHQKAH